MSIASIQSLAGRLGVLLLFTVALGLLQRSIAQEVTYRPDRLILLPKKGADVPGLQKVHAKKGRRVLKKYNALGDMQVIQLAPGEKPLEAAAQYLSSGLVEFAEPDYKLRASALPNDPYFVDGQQWPLRNMFNPGRDINAAAGWETLASASNIVVAVIDSGIRFTHEDLADNMWVNPGEVPGNGIDDDKNGFIDDVHGINAVDLSGDIMDEAGHGTHVAGIVGAVGDNQVGIAGVAWNVRLMGCKFLDRFGDGDTSDAIRGIDYARRQGAHIINASWGGLDFSQALYTAVSEARDAGIIVVTASGNDSMNIDNVPLYPACYDLDNIVVVGGTSGADIMDSSYSNYGAVNVDVCAPGTDILSTWSTWDGAYNISDGTSMAAPHVAGVLALMRARFPHFSPEQLISRLYATVDVLPALEGKCRTSGRVNLGRALGGDPTAAFSMSRRAGEPPLAVSFTNQSVGDVRSLFWDFGDGSAVVTNSGPTHVFARAGTFSVKLTVVGGNGRTDSFEQQVDVSANYQIEPAPFGWIAPSGMSVLSLSDNGVSPPQPVPFPVQFYGETYTSVYVSANGLIGFDPLDLTNTMNNGLLPSESRPNGIIAPYWDNLNPAAGGTIHVGISGVEPTRRFVVSWVEVPRNSGAVPLTFQAVIEEETGEFLFQYLDVRPQASRGGAKGATIGVENGTGSMAALYTYNGVPYVLANQSALRVKPRAYRYLTAEPARVNFTHVIGMAPPPPIELHLSNPGTQSLEWQVQTPDPWLGIEAASGSLAPGQSTLLPVSLLSNVATFGLGEYTGSISVTNLTDGHGSTVVPVVLSVQPPRAVLSIATAETNFTGGLGGPFSPDALFIQAVNSGNVPLDWTGSADVPWLSLQPASGHLAPGEQRILEVLLGDVTTFESGIFTGSVRLENATDPAAPPIETAVHLEVRARIQQAAASIENGVFRGSLRVPPGASCSVEYSDDLVFWFPFDGEISISDSEFKFEDPWIFGAQRFYRVLVE